MASRRRTTPSIPFNRPRLSAGGSSSTSPRRWRTSTCPATARSPSVAARGSASALGSERVLLHAVRHRRRSRWARCCSGIEQGDEVIMPSFTFPTTASAFALRGATPGVRRHPRGHPQPRRDADRGGDHPAHEGDPARPLRRRRLRDGGSDRDRPIDHGLAVLEDAAHAIGRRHGAGAPLGTFGCARRDLVPRDEERHLRRGRRAADQRSGRSSSAPRSCGRRAPTARPSSAARSTSTPGSTSARPSCMSDMNAAFLLAQLEHLDAINRRADGRSGTRYMAAFEGLEQARAGPPAGRAGRRRRTTATSSTFCSRAGVDRDAVIATREGRRRASRLPLRAAAQLARRGPARPVPPARSSARSGSAKA